MTCEHMCSSNCRRDGCNCECGECHCDPSEECKYKEDGDCPNHPNTGDHKYAVEVKLMDRFYELYEEGKKKGVPRGYLEFFAIQHFVLVEVEKALEYGKGLKKDS